MTLVPMDQLASGMILSADAVDEGGHVLLLKGHVLDDKNLEVLRKRGMTDVMVEEPGGEPKAEPVKETPPVEAVSEEMIAQEEVARRKAHMERIQHMFEGRLGDPVMKRIFTVAIKRAHAGVTRD